MSFNARFWFAGIFVMIVFPSFLAVTATAQLALAAKSLLQAPAGGKAEPGQVSIRIEPFELRQNLLPNSSFEKIDEKQPAAACPAGWNWYRGKTDAAVTVDSSQAHTGKHSLRITNSTPYGPHVFGMLRLPSDVAVKPNTTYTFSCYVKGDMIGVAWFGGGRDWLVRNRFPKSTAGHWARVALTFTTDKDTTKIPVIMAIESPCEPFWVDDVQLVEGPDPMPVLDRTAPDQAVLQVEFPAAAATRHRGHIIIPEWNRTQFPREKYIFASSKLRAVGDLYLPRDVVKGELNFLLARPDGTKLLEQTRRGTLPAGTYKLFVDCPIEKIQDDDIRVHVGLQGELAAKPDDSQNADNSQLVLGVNHSRRLITLTHVRAAIGCVEKLRDQLKSHIQAIRDTQHDPAYPLVTLTILDNFINYAKQDLDRGEVARAYDAALQMQAMAKRAIVQKYLPPVPRYQSAKSGRSFRLEGAKQLGTVRWPGGRIESERPLQFLGLGHFTQVKRDIEKANKYGCNIIQIEIGPRSVITSEDKINTAVIDEYLTYFDRAAKAGVTINLLVSPHYFPNWAFEKWPHLRDAGGGFLQVDVQAPESRVVYEKFLRVLIPRIKDHPALHSICLSNEPVFVHGEKSAHVRNKWHEWLRRLHGNIETLNRRWKSDHADFTSIPVPTPEKITFSPIYVDYMRFNREAFAEFHSWMADTIRSMAPDVPLHAKIMVCANFGRHAHGPWSISPDLFARLSNINGNDAWKYYHSNGDWASNWQGENMGYDFQRSMSDKLVFNSENHLIPDRHFEPIPPEHIYNVFWQGAIHGQSATTTWVWERSFSYTADTSGSIMHRPACTEAMGHAGLDLMRLAKEVDALQNLPLEIAILWSPTSVVAGEHHPTLVKQVYEALNFQGMRVGFVTERQLQDSLKKGALPPTLANLKLIVAAGVSNAPESTVKALQNFRQKGGHVLCVGKCFDHDEYGHKRESSTQEKPFAHIEMPSTTRELFDVLRQRLSTIALSRPVHLQSADGKSAWGVEYLAAKQNGRLLINMANYLNKTQKVSFIADGRPVVGTDLLSGREIGPVIELGALQPVLLEVKTTDIKR